MAFGLALTGCGGGGGGGTSATTTTTPPQAQAVDYSCDKAATLAAVPRTAGSASTSASVFAYVSENLSTQYQNPAVNAVSITERWPLVIDGKNEELNVVIAKPASPSTPINGIIIWNHGTDVAQATQPATNTMDFVLANQMTNRGYVVVAVARRGNFGSTGEMGVSGQAGIDLSNKYLAGTVTFAGLTLIQQQYQSASIVAALDKMSKDAAYVPYLKNLIMMGGSGGADVSTQTAADSAVFKGATKRLVVRLAGAMSTQLDSDPKAVPGADEYAAKLAASVNASTLWFQGELDTLTSSGIVACQYKFYAASAKAAGYTSQLYVLPNAGHVSNGFLLFTTILSGIFKKAAIDEGFIGFAN